MNEINQRVPRELSGGPKDLDPDIRLKLNFAVFEAKYCHSPNVLELDGHLFNVYANGTSVYFEHAKSHEKKYLRVKSLGQAMEGTGGLWASVLYELREMIAAA